MSLRDEIYEQVKQAMKARDQVKLDALRFVWSEIKRLEIDQGEMNDEQITQWLMGEVKRRKDAIDQFEKAGRQELALDERNKLQFITAFLPKMMNEDEVRTVVKQAMSQGEKQFGTLMQMVMARLKGKAEGGMVSRLVKEELK